MGKQDISSAYVTAGERQKLRHVGGTTALRTGEDSQLKFGSCALCLHDASGRHPMASPSGWIYCRECIFEYLLTQKAALEERRREHELAKSRLESAKARAAQLQDEERAAAFAKREILAAAEADPAVARSASSRIDGRSADEKVMDASATSFWIPSSLHTADAAEAGAPDSCPRDPMDPKAFLRAKQLVSVNFARETVRVGEGDEDSKDVFKDPLPLCQCCKDGLKYHQAFLFAPCGHVVCAGCTEKFCVASKACVCGKKAKRGGIVALKRGGSSFVANEGTQAVAKTYSAGKSY